MVLPASSSFTTSTGSTISVRTGGNGSHPIFAIGGISSLSFGETPIRTALEEAERNGARWVLMDIAGSGASRADAAVTMDSWLADVEDVFREFVAEPASWTAASMGAWLMMLAHRRHPQWARDLCALAPVFDWDRLYLAPGLQDGRLRWQGGAIVDASGVALARRELIDSMPRHHILEEPFALAAPAHVIAGLRDPVAPIDATRGFVELAHGASCTGEIIPDGDHGVAKLRPPAVVSRYEAWIRQRLAPARASPASP
jgi:pimeloyl-ACP methyl ester carboxylesterase